MEEQTRVVRYKVHPGVGGRGSWRHGSLVELLLSLPYPLDVRVPRAGSDLEDLVHVIPPMAPLNSLLNSGTAEAGMSGGAEWKPFQIGADEYDQLVERLLTDPRFDFVLPEDPHSVLPFHEWLLNLVAQSRRAETP